MKRLCCFEGRLPLSQSTIPMTIFQSVSLNGSGLIVKKLTQERLEPFQEQQSPPYAASYLSALVF